MPVPKKVIFRQVFFLFTSLTLVSLLPAALVLSEVEGPAQVQSYDQLLSAIRGVRSQTQQRIEQAVSQEKVREAWETGKLIDKHILQHARAEYGQQVLLRLSKDLNTSDEELSFMVQFAKAYPISWPAKKLSWSHYQALLSLNDPQERAEVEEKAEKENWSRDQVREEVRKRKAEKSDSKPKPEVKLTPVKLGKVGSYRIVKASAGPAAGKLVIDLGFSNYYKTTKDLRFKEGDILETVPAGPGPGSAPVDKIKSSKRILDDLYTYNAYVYEIIDGDTIKAVIDLGFGVQSVQTLRLRGLDAPELVSREGKEAKVFLEKLLGGKRKQTDFASPVPLPSSFVPVLIRTVKSDKYDRYLTDVFVNGEYVNQKLVENGFATVMND